MAEAAKKSGTKLKTQAKTADKKIDTVDETDKKPEIAKAGKRSAKAVKASEEKQVKAAKKSDASEGATEAKKIIKRPPRTRLERAGKKYRELAKKIDSSKAYNLAEAMALACQTSPTKFDAAVEIHINLNADPKQAEQNIRGTVVLPAGTGKNIKVAVLAEGGQVPGADIVGKDEILARLDKEQIDFDVLITTPQFMPQLGKYARLLGPRGLMPNPKSGTVTSDLAKAVSEAKAGRVEYRMDSAGIIHVAIGKVSFGADKLLQNGQALLSSIRSAKPPSIKGGYIKSIYVSSTMGPSIRVDNLAS